MSQLKDRFETCRTRAATGDREAVYQLATMYFNGDGVEQNRREAACLWHEIASFDEEESEEIEVAASYMYALCCSKGIGIGVDDEEAFAWMRGTAERGDALAQKALCDMYLSSRGCEHNQPEAYYWLVLATALGCADPPLAPLVPLIGITCLLESCFEDTERERVEARCMRTLTVSLRTWADLNARLEEIRRRFPVHIDGQEPPANRRHVVPEEMQSSPTACISVSIEDAEFVRWRTHLSQDDLSRLIGVTRATYHTWRRGGAIRRSNQQRLDGVVAAMRELVDSAQWPSVEERLIKAADKVDLLRGLLAGSPTKE